MPFSIGCASILDADYKLAVKGTGLENGLRLYDQTSVRSNHTEIRMTGTNYRVRKIGQGLKAQESEPHPRMVKIPKRVAPDSSYVQAAFVFRLVNA